MSPRRPKSEPVEASRPRVAQTPEEKELHRARKRATRLLAATDRSRAELEERLVGAGFAATVVARVLDEFTRAKLLDDTRLADRLIERELGRAPADAPLLRRKLERKGVEELLTDRAIDRALQSRDTLADARDAAVMRLRAMPDARRLGHVRLVGRLLGFLARRGFNQETSEAAVEAVLRAERLWNPPEEG